MKIYSYWLAICLLGIALAGSLSPANAQFQISVPPAPKPTAVVAAFSVADGVSRDAGDKMIGILEKALRDSGKYMTVDRQSLEKSVGPLSFSDNAIVGDESRKKIAQAHAADYVASGRILQLTPKHPLGRQTVEVSAEVAIRVIDVATGSVVYQRTRTGTGTDSSNNVSKATEEALTKVGDQFKEDLRGSFSLRGNVTEFLPEAGRVVIDKGMKDGVTKDAYFEFYLVTEIVDANGRKSVVQEKLPLRARPRQGTRDVQRGQTTLEFGEYTKDGVRWVGSKPDAQKLTALIEKWKKEHPGRTPKVIVNTIQPPDRRK